MTLYGKEHVERYEATDGEEGYDWQNGTTILLLHTTGRKSGKEYTHPLIFRESTATTSSSPPRAAPRRRPSGTATSRPNPTSRSRSRTRSSRRNARDGHADEKPALWEHMVEVWPDYAEYQKKTDREIPVVVLEPAA